MRHPTVSPRQNPAREDFAGGLGGSLNVRNRSGLVGRGQWPVVVGRMWLGAITRAPPVRKTPRLPGAGRLFFPRNSTQAPGGFVTFDPSGTEHLPLPPGARREDPSGAAGTCQAGVCGASAFRGRAARPDRDADQTPPVEDHAARLPLARKARTLHVPQPVPVLRADKTLGLIHLDPAGPRADRGVASQASGPQVRCPRAKTHRLPPARAPSAPAIRSGRKVGGSLAWGGRVWKMWGVVVFSLLTVQKTPPQPLPTRGRGLDSRSFLRMTLTFRRTQDSRSENVVDAGLSPSPLWGGVGEGSCFPEHRFAARGPA
jgi:hypothetical protein